MDMILIFLHTNRVYSIMSNDFLLSILYIVRKNTYKTYFVKLLLLNIYGIIGMYFSAVIISCMPTKVY